MEELDITKIDISCLKESIFFISSAYFTWYSSVDMGQWLKAIQLKFVGGFLEFEPMTS